MQDEPTYNVQKKPLKGLIEVYPHAVANITHTLEQQYAKGKAKYDTVLETFNNRNAVQDAFEEMADLVQYVTQISLETLTYKAILIEYVRRNPELLLEICENDQEKYDIILRELGMK